MRIETNPIYRKVIPPWYDSDAACLVSILLLLLLVLFGTIGIHVANEIPEYQAYLWLPVLLIMLCAGLIISILIRLKDRFFSRLSQK